MMQVVPRVLSVMCATAAVFALGACGEGVSVSGSSQLPDPAKINRADDAGAETVEAYLSASLRCGSKEAVEIAGRLSGGRDPMASVRNQACRDRDAAGSWAEELDADLDEEAQSDSRGRQVWRVTGSDSLPKSYNLVVRMPREQWEVESACTQDCAVAR